MSVNTVIQDFWKIGGPKGAVFSLKEAFTRLFLRVGLQ